MLETGLMAKETDLESFTMRMEVNTKATESMT